jgi:hypothetical protein
MNNIGTKEKLMTPKNGYSSGRCEYILNSVEATISTKTIAEARINQSSNISRSILIKPSRIHYHVYDMGKNKSILYEHISAKSSEYTEYPNSEWINNLT